MAVLAFRHPATVMSSTPILAKELTGFRVPIEVSSDVSPEKISSLKIK
jgi:hypothetical protein